MNNLEYQWRDKTWLVQALPAIRPWIDVSTPEQFSQLHEACASQPDLDMSWAIIQRLGGIIEVGALDQDAAKLHPMTEAEICDLFKIQPDELSMYFDFVKLAWAAHLNEVDLPSVRKDSDAEKKKRPVITTEQRQFTDDELDLLQKGSFKPTIFDYYSGPDRTLEINWFLERIVEVGKIFEQPMAKALARNALLNELQISRMNDKLITLDPAGKDFCKLQETKQDTEKAYGEQWKQIEEICPGVVATQERKMQLTNFAALTRQYLDFKADPKNRLRDGVFTDEEIQVVLRPSAQFESRYRFGWICSVNEARLNLGDPRYRRRIPLLMCKVLDSSVAHGIKKMWARLRLPVPDLTDDSAAGEFLKIGGEGQITEPEPIDVDEEPNVAVVEIEEPTVV